MVGFTLASASAPRNSFHCTERNIARTAPTAARLSPPHLTFHIASMNKIKEKIAGFKDAESGKTGASGVMAEGKDRYQDYKTDAADGKVNWMQQGKNALTDYKADTAAASGGAAGTQPQGNPM